MKRLQLLLAATAIFLGACKPEPGSSCDKGEARCIDKQSQLVCQSGKYIAAPCKGPRGCGITPDGISCDISANQPGDVCSTDEEGASSCIDAKTKIVCTGGKFEAILCRGPRGCEAQAGRPLCDNSIAQPDDVCKDSEKTKACSVDGRQYLACSGGKMTMQFQCLGPGGCKSTGGQLSCDMSYARDKDPCRAEMEGKHACNLDHSSIVICKAGRFVIDEECKDGSRCQAEGSIRCEKPEKP